MSAPSTQTFTGALYTLAEEWDKYAPLLRQEVLENLEQGKVTAKTLQNLPRMESFMRESARFNLSGLSE